ncbi:hypothetical protein CARUB_v10018960mg [Capsella rubella]|uniref:F-box domain-containing protein n=1 Tax=Capsella rubella TaxID=81985 RepID=R0FS45_9BRAS|nr:hypothetical protein CARUB_v10018960mg [Capsella rubella]
MDQCSESLGNRGFASEDRISELPEALLLQLLSSLPTKIVIATSVLSKRWRSLWKLVPKLEFIYNESEGNIQKFSENVGRSLLSHKALFLESFHLKVVGGQCDDVYIGMWAGIAFARHVREFVLDLERFYGKPVSFPSSLFCFDKVETLKLKSYILLDVPSPVSMKSLRTLHLESVVYKDDKSVRNLFSSCPNLEDLAPSLKTLSIRDPTSGRETGGYAINAPSLRYLEIDCLRGYQFCLIQNASELVEANIKNVSYVVNDNILESLRSAKLLSLDLSPLEITYPTGGIFHRLVYLEIYTHKAEWWNLLTLMLESSPKLQVLNLVDDVDKQLMDGGKWEQPKYVSECLLSHLEIFVWTIYDCDREEEKEVAKYILRSARRLKTATFSTGPIGPKKRLVMLNELKGVVKASNSCHLVFE